MNYYRTPAWLCRGSLVFIMAFWGLLLHAQEQATDTSLPHLQQSLSNATALYNESVKNQLLIFNGPEYNEFPEPYNGFPYFKSEYWEEGSIHYDGEQYDSITMMYDIYTDELVIEHYDQKGYAAKVKLDKNKIDRFSLLGSSFVKLTKDSAERAGVRPGFYDVAYNGNVKLMAKRRKDIVKETTQNTILTEFVRKDDFYVYKDGVYYPVRRKKSILKVFGDKKKAVRQFIKKNHLSFSNETRGHAFTQIVAFYDTSAN